MRPGGRLRHQDNKQLCTSNIWRNFFLNESHNKSVLQDWHNKHVEETALVQIVTCLKTNPTDMVEAASCPGLRNRIEYIGKMLWIYASSGRKTKDVNSKHRATDRMLECQDQDPMPLQDSPARLENCRIQNPSIHPAWLNCSYFAKSGQSCQSVKSWWRRTQKACSLRKMLAPF